MKKKLLVVALIVAIHMVLFGCGRIGTLDNAKRDDTDKLKAELSQIDENLSLDPESGVVFVSNEIILMVTEDSTESEIEQLAETYGAEIKESMPDIGIYKFNFSERMSHDEILQLIEKFKMEPSIEDAFENPVMEVEGDTAVDILSDPWDGDAIGRWTVFAPSGSNWGMEAIDAPAAWGHLSEMTDVNVALIDTFVDTSGDIGNMEVLSAIEVSVSGTFVEPEPLARLSPEDHGTHVAGIMAATYDNNIGVTGVMGDKGRLHYANVIRYSGSEDYTSAYDYLSEIGLLVRNDVKVINISQNTSRLIGFAADRGNSRAINYLRASSVIMERGLKRIIEAGYEFVICVAAGNNNSPHWDHCEYYKDESTLYGYRDYDNRTLWEQIWNIRGDSGNVDTRFNNFLNLIDDEEVENRIIVVGSVKIDEKTAGENVRYKYSEFSNIGNRVDVVAPGEDIYSTVVGRYERMNGTSMAAPHVSGVAGLIFACNPNLTGKEVKEILLASTVGRFYYTDGYSGMVNAGIAVENALLTKGRPVERVLTRGGDSGLDVCFVIDTTGSMRDDIQNARENMSNILENINAKSDDFRVSIVDYRDFPGRTGVLLDYESRLQLGFSSDNREITSTIDNLELGDGGDEKETVYSGLMLAASLDWRPYAQKVIVILGDAAPLDPEPFTGYTFDDVLAMLSATGISIDIDSSDYATILKSVASGTSIRVFSVGTDASSDAESFFRDISMETGGAYTGVESASEVSDAIISSIEQIEAIQRKTVDATLGIDYANAVVELFRDGEFLFEFPLDDNGSRILENMEIGSYEWSVPDLSATGDMYVSETSDAADIRILEAASARVEEKRNDPGFPLKAAAVALAAALVAAIVVALAVAANSRRLLPEASGGAFARAPGPVAMPDFVSEPAPLRAAALVIMYNGVRGAEIPLRDGETVNIGRDRRTANIVLTENAEKISRLHCTITYKADDDCYYVTDLSRNGTFLADMTHLPQKTRVVLNRNTTLYLADRRCGILLK
jgi:subtilisin family serine protease